MICVFDVVDGPAKGKRFWIRLNEKFEVGRISTANFSIPNDQQMSRHHLVLEGRLTGFQVRDVGSTNGTFVNDAQVRSIELCDGDRIRAGDSIFEVSILQSATPPQSDEFTDSDTKPPEKPRSRESDELPSLDSDGDSTSRVHSEILMERTYRNRVASLDFWESLGFVRSSQDFLLADPSDPQDAEAIGLTSILDHLDSQYAVQALVHVEPLRRFETQLLQKFGVTEDELQQDFVLVNDVVHSPEFRVFAEGLLSRNTLVLAGYHQQDPPSIADWPQTFTPNELDAQATRTSSFSRVLFNDTCAWLLFEQIGKERLQVIDLSQLT
ncbi:MAG: FHA domain-containing protein [Aureliella sp.]